MDNQARRGHGSHPNHQSEREPRPSLDSYPDVLVPAEVAQVLRLSKASIYRGVRQGSIPAIRINRRVLIPKAIIADLLQRPRRSKKEY